VIPRIRAMLGDERPFELEWVSVYTFQCRRLDRFVHGRVIFAGDAAHQVSPFGARGANSGFQDIDNLCWKLARVLRGQSPASLLDSYDRERVEAAEENILNSTRATDFITPKTLMSRTFRDAVLSLSQRHPFARRLVNSGRLSMPTTHRGSALSSLDRDVFAGAMVPGAPAADAPVRVRGAAGWLLDELGGHFDLLVFGPVAPPWLDELQRSLGGEVRLTLIVARPTDSATAGVRVMEDVEGLMRQRYDSVAGTVYLLRPDQHVAARWRAPRLVEVLEGLVRAQGRGGH
jgi:3-(3-hydroxy-phenyl)propionate hydroxylase